MPPATAARPQGCTNFKTRQLSRLLSRHYDAELAACGLKTTQYSLLSHVVQLGPIAPGELARRMGLDASTLTRNLQPLLAAGWLLQDAGPDARTRSIRRCCAWSHSARVTVCPATLATVSWAPLVKRE